MVPKIAKKPQKTGLSNTKCCTSSLRTTNTHFLCSTISLPLLPHWRDHHLHLQGRVFWCHWQHQDQNQGSVSMPFHIDAHCQPWAPLLPTSNMWSLLVRWRATIPSPITTSRRTKKGQCMFSFLAAPPPILPESNSRIVVLLPASIHIYALMHWAGIWYGHSVCAHHHSWSKHNSTDVSDCMVGCSKWGQITV